MEATDLMIGDWVLISVWGCKPFPSKVTSINYNSYQGKDFVDWIDTEDEEEIGMYNVQPIPLTPEILEKNGFERDIAEEQKYSSIMGESFKGFYKIPSIPKKYTGFYLEAWGGVYTITDHQMMRIENVHELQHVLKLCGIDKEIVL